jgi:hypothetical protein
VRVSDYSSEPSGVSGSGSTAGGAMAARLSAAWIRTAAIGGPTRPMYPCAMRLRRFSPPGCVRRAAKNRLRDSGS